MLRKVRKERIKMIIACSLLIMISTLLVSCSDMATSLGIKKDNNNIGCCNYPKFDPGDLLINGQERDFCGRKVMVAMAQSAGGYNKVHDPSIFGDIGLIDIEDLTSGPEDSIIHPEVFHQILLFTLDIDSKENVLRVVERLNKLKEVCYVSPDLYLSPYLSPFSIDGDGE